MIDLHSHTTASDGQHAPGELLAMAAAAGVTCLSVTDHDTVAGLADAQAAARTLGVELVPGIELSAFVGRKEVHILGHFLDPTHPALLKFSALLKTERESRMGEIVKKLQNMNLSVRLDDVKRIARDGHLGRPHLALLLVEKGYCTSTKEAFDRYLGDGRSAWVDRYRLSALEAVNLIKDAGGVATLAHPATSRVDRADIVLLKEAGLGGIEVFHTDQGPADREKLMVFSRTFDLVPTAGSDFHGEQVAPGRKLGSAAMPPEHYEALKSRSARG